MTLDFYLTRGMIERAALELGPNPYQETAAVSVWLALAGHGRRPIPKTNGTTVGLPRQCEIRVVLTRVFSRPKISAWVPLGRRGEYGGVTYVSVSGCPFRWITPLFYPCLQMPGYPPLWGDASRHSGGMGGRHQIRRGVGRRRRVGRAGGYRGVPDTDKPERKRTLL